MKNTSAKAASSMRKELKCAFPGVKFSVTSERYSGGSSIDVDWIGGPILDDVRKVTGKYQYGHFDGMNDTYVFSKTNKDIDQVQFVFLQRGM